MVRQIVEVVATKTGGYWYRATCGHEIIALDYNPTRERATIAGVLEPAHKEFVFCQTCWLTEKTRPTSPELEAAIEAALLSSGSIR